MWLGLAVVGMMAGLYGLLYLRRTRLAPAAGPGSSMDGAATTTPRQAQRAGQQRMGPSVSEIAVGVFIGLWMFAATATALVLVLLAAAGKGFEAP